MTYRPRIETDALILARNDVLIDVSRSGPETAAQTVQTYLEHAIGLLPGSEPLLTPDEVCWLYRQGHFCDYQAAATALIIYFTELLPPAPYPTFSSKYYMPAIIAYLQLAGSRLPMGIDDLRRQKDMRQLTGQINQAGGGLDAADQILPRRNRHLLVADGDITRTNLVGRIFEEIYLGTALFEQVYQQPPVITHNRGIIQQESLLMDPALLAKLAERLPLAVVGPGSAGELAHTLRRHQLEPYFQAAIAQDDVQAARAQPIPAPWSLLEAARRLRPTPAHTACLMSTRPGLMAVRAAARTSPFTAIGCLAGAPDKPALQQAFEQAKAEIIIGHPNHIKELILD